MIQHRYGLNPATGRVEHYTVDHGPVKVPYLRGSAMVPLGAQKSDLNYGRKVTGAGS